MSYNKKTNMYEGYIYKVTNNINGRMYIGQTMRTIDIRWREHVKDSMSESDDYYFHRAIRKYKEYNFVIEEIETIYGQTLKDLKLQLNKRERHYINVFDTYNPNGYNGALGGEGSSIRPIDYYSLDKKLVCKFNSMTEASEFTGLSLTSITENCNGVSSGTRCGFFRYKDEPLNKFETLYKYNGAVQINKFNIDGILVKSYKSCKDIQEEYNVSRRVVLRWKSQHVLVDHQFVFFLDTEDFDYSKIKLPYISEIDVFDLDGNYVQRFKNQSEASRALNIDSSTISKCCLGKLDHVKDFVFRKHIINL